MISTNIRKQLIKLYLIGVNFVFYRKKCNFVLIDNNHNNQQTTTNYE